MDSTIFKSLNVNGRLLDLSIPQVMGILNVTPDSFYAGSRSRTEADIAARARQILDEGASMIDIGAYSSRPNAEHISPEEEMRRLRTGTQYTPDGSPNLSDLTFLPKAGFTGSVQIGYEGTDSRGKTFRGQIRIQVNQGSGSRYFQDMGSYAWAAPYVDLL